MADAVNWDDLRFVLAVADTGSLAGAARALGVNHATVLRRVAAVETRAGRAIFDRTPRGYVVSPEARETIEALRGAGDAIARVERRIAGGEAVAALRVATVDSLAVGLMPGVLADVAKASGERLLVLAANARLDLGRGQAEIAIRPGPVLARDLAGEVAGEMGFAAYGVDGAEGWLSDSGRLARAGHGIAAAEGGALGADSFVALTAMAAAGLGKAVLPAILGDAEPRLSRIDPAADPVAAEARKIRVPVWVASHGERAEEVRLRRLRARITEAIRARKDLLLGAAD